MQTPYMYALTTLYVLHINTMDFLSLLELILVSKTNFDPNIYLLILQCIHTLIDTCPILYNLPPLVGASPSWRDKNLQ